MYATGGVPPVLNRGFKGGEPMRVLVLLCLLAQTVAADVVLLKDGSRVVGKVTEKADHLEVTTESGLRTFLKDEVTRVVNTPKEFLGDADKTLDEVKQAYQAAIAIADPAEQQARVKEAIQKLKTAREAYASTRELFPEDKYADLDQKLMQVMQLMRLCRDRLHSEASERRFSDPVQRPVLASGMALPEAFSILRDPAKRSDASRRAAARDAFRTQRAGAPEIYEIATAAMLFLARSDAEWNLQGAALKVLQDYFARPWLKDPSAMTAVMHQEAAKYLAEQVTLLRKADAAAQVEPLTLFGIGHVGHAPTGPESDKLAILLGLKVVNGIAGTPEGHVVRDLNGWIAAGDFDLAVMAWIKEFREIDTPITRYVWSYALLRVVQAKKRNYERAISGFQSVPATTPALREHLLAIVKSIKAVAICNTCGGEGKLRCTNCFGKKEIRWVCQKCKGAGKVPDPGSPAYLIPCYPCRGRGYDKLLKCEKCKDGYNECHQCDRKQHQPPELEDICTLTPCEQCDARGFVFRRILWACKSCMGTGQKLAPKTDLTKTLP
jgi:hypothetical protein